MKNSISVKGIGVTNIRVIGRLRFFDSSRIAVKRAPMSREIEIKRLEDAVKRAIENIRGYQKTALLTLGKNEAHIFEIHAMLLQDEDFYDTVIEEISKGNSCEDAISVATERLGEMLLATKDEYLSARVSDLRDVSNQLLEILGSATNKNEELYSSEPYILVAEDLTPSETVRLDKSRILGFVTFGGSSSSHTAILARAMGIPALVGVGKLSRENDGVNALLDANRGELIINPTEEEIRELELELERSKKIAIEHDRYLRSIMTKPAVTRSGHRIMIYANIGSEYEIDGALSNGAEGIGLLRSELMYLEKTREPTEEELFEEYKKIAIKMQGKRVIVRVLDIGADKHIPYFKLEKEENPALGLRGIRVLLANERMFKNQLRAILRSSHYGSVAIMLPMIVSLEEVRQCKELINECKAELTERGERFDSKAEIGIMIETPASAIMSDALAKEVDFFSVGTNDLGQYTLAVDRQNSLVSELCERNTEPILRLIKKSADAIHENGGWIGVCGEMAADLSMTQKLLDVGVDELSVSVPYLLGVRGKVSECK